MSGPYYDEYGNFHDDPVDDPSQGGGYSPPSSNVAPAGSSVIDNDLLKMILAGMGAAGQHTTSSSSGRADSGGGGSSSASVSSAISSINSAVSAARSAMANIPAPGAYSASAGSNGAGSASDPNVLTAYQSGQLGIQQANLALQQAQANGTPVDWAKLQAQMGNDAFNQWLTGQQLGLAANNQAFNQQNTLFNQGISAGQLGVQQGNLALGQQSLANTAQTDQNNFMLNLYNSMTGNTLKANDQQFQQWLAQQNLGLATNSQNLQQYQISSNVDIAQKQLQLAQQLGQGDQAQGWAKLGLAAEAQDLQAFLGQGNLALGQQQVDQTWARLAADIQAQGADTVIKQEQLKIQAQVAQAQGAAAQASAAAQAAQAQAALRGVEVQLQLGNQNYELGKQQLAQLDQSQLRQISLQQEQLGQKDKIDTADLQLRQYLGMAGIQAQMAGIAQQKYATDVGAGTTRYVADLQSATQRDQMAQQAQTEKLNLIASLRGPRDYFQYLKVLRGANEQGVPNGIAALSNGQEVAGFEGTHGTPEAISLQSFLHDTGQSLPGQGNAPVQYPTNPGLPAYPTTNWSAPFQGLGPAPVMPGQGGYTPPAPTTVPSGPQSPQLAAVQAWMQQQNQTTAPQQAEADRMAAAGDTQGAMVLEDQMHRQADAAFQQQFGMSMQTAGQQLAQQQQAQAANPQQPLQSTGASASPAPASSSAGPAGSAPPPSAPGAAPTPGLQIPPHDNGPAYTPTAQNTVASYYQQYQNYLASQPPAGSQGGPPPPPYTYYTPTAPPTAAALPGAPTFNFNTPQPPRQTGGIDYGPGYTPPPPSAPPAPYSTAAGWQPYTIAPYGGPSGGGASAPPSTSTAPTGGATGPAATPAGATSGAAGNPGGVPANVAVGSNDPGIYNVGTSAYNPASDNAARNAGAGSANAYNAYINQATADNARYNLGLAAEAANAPLHEADGVHGTGQAYGGGVGFTSHIDAGSPTGAGGANSGSPANHGNPAAGSSPGATGGAGLDPQQAIASTIAATVPTIQITANSQPPQYTITPQQFTQYSTNPQVRDRYVHEQAYAQAYNAYHAQGGGQYGAPTGPLSPITAPLGAGYGVSGSYLGAGYGAQNSYASGTTWVPQDMNARVHEGEMIVPAGANPAAGDPNAGYTADPTLPPGYVRNAWGNVEYNPTNPLAQAQPQDQPGYTPPAASASQDLNAITDLNLNQPVAPPVVPGVPTDPNASLPGFGGTTDPTPAADSGSAQNGIDVATGLPVNANLNQSAPIDPALLDDLRGILQGSGLPANQIQDFTQRLNALGANPDPAEIEKIYNDMLSAVGAANGFAPDPSIPGALEPGYGRDMWGNVVYNPVRDAQGNITFGPLTNENYYIPNQSGPNSRSGGGPPVLQGGPPPGTIDAYGNPIPPANGPGNGPGTTPPPATPAPENPGNKPAVPDGVWNVALHDQLYAWVRDNVRDGTAQNEFFDRLGQVQNGTLDLAAFRQSLLTYAQATTPGGANNGDGYTPPNAGTGLGNAGPGTPSEQELTTLFGFIPKSPHDVPFRIWDELLPTERDIALAAFENLGYAVPDVAELIARTKPGSIATNQSYGVVGK